MKPPGPLSFCGQSQVIFRPLRNLLDLKSTHAFILCRGLFKLKKKRILMYRSALAAITVSMHGLPPVKRFPYSLFLELGKRERDWVRCTCLSWAWAYLEHLPLVDLAGESKALAFIEWYIKHTLSTPTSSKYHLNLGTCLQGRKYCQWHCGGGLLLTSPWYCPRRLDQLGHFAGTELGC